MKSYDQSGFWYRRASAVTPGGAQTASKAPGRVGPIGAYPLYLDRAKGAYVRDVDQHKYVDWFNGNCAITLGHANSAIHERVLATLKAFGALPSLPTTLETHAGDDLVELIPCAQQVRFLKTGSEACAAAVRIARIATERTVIAVCRGQYHGWHDWTIARNDFAPGVPYSMRDDIATFTYNDLDSLEELLGNRRSRDMDVAAVMLEPTLVEAPAEGFLQGAVDLAHAHGALVIFDEMICGGRWALGGAQQYFGVTPDLSCHGKAYANGFPLAFVAGPSGLMQHAWPISGTFGGEVVSLAACLAALVEYRRSGAIERIWTAGRRLMDGANGIAARVDLPMRLVGYACRPVTRWTVDSAIEPVAVALLQQELAEAGVLVHPSGWNPSAAHDAVAVERTLTACDQAFTKTAEALAGGDPEAHLRGDRLQPVFVRQEVITP
jgi:glutamate-1-semialdehyde aminotransferase